MGMAAPSRYAVDGIGRDTYIETNNGGLYRPHRPASAMSVGTFVSIKKPENNLCDVGTKRTNYCYNGSGRDSYIG